MSNRRIRRLRTAAVAAGVLAASLATFATPGSPTGAAPRATTFKSQVVVPLTGLTTPYGVAVSGIGSVAATQYGDGATTQASVVRRPFGGPQTTLAFGTLGSPFGAAFDNDGTTYVSDLSANTVVKLASGSSSPTTLGFTGLLNPAGIAVDASGAVYVADSGNARVVKLSGSTQTTLPFTGLSNPYGVAVDEDGNVYVVDADDNNVRELPAGGSQVTLGFTGLSSPDGIAVNDDGDVYVADAGNDRVVRLIGSTQSTLGFSGLSAPAGVAVGPDGSVFVADSNNDRIVELPADTPFSPFVSWSGLIKRQYLDIVGQAPSAGSLASWTSKLEGGTSTPGDLVVALRTSSENLTNVDPVTRLYSAYFLRIPDKGGLTYWIGKRRGGVSLNKISATFAASSEFKTRYGTLTNRAFVNLVYQNVLGRPGEAGGVNYWTGQLDKHKKSRGQVMTGFSESSEYKRTDASEVEVSVQYIFLLGRAPSTSEFNDGVADLDGGTTAAELAEDILGGSEYAVRVR